MSDMHKRANNIDAYVTLRPSVAYFIRQECPFCDAQANQTARELEFACGAAARAGKAGVWELVTPCPRARD